MAQTLSFIKPKDFLQTINDWKPILEQGDPLIEGSGWGEVRDLKIADSNQH